MQLLYRASAVMRRVDTLGVPPKVLVYTELPSPDLY